MQTARVFLRRLLNTIFGFHIAIIYNDSSYHDTWKMIQLQGGPKIESMKFIPTGYMGTHIHWHTTKWQLNSRHFDISVAVGMMTANLSQEQSKWILKQQINDTMYTDFGAILRIFLHDILHGRILNALYPKVTKVSPQTKHKLRYILLRS